MLRAIQKTHSAQRKMTEQTAAHRDLANAIRALAMDAVQQADSGHPGMPMGMADVATVLFQKFLKFDPSDPHWPDRDRFVLSAGHGSMLLYSALYLLGYEEMTIDQLQNFRQLGSRTAGTRVCRRHREHHRTPRAGHRQRRRHGRGGDASGGPVRRRPRRPPHLG